MSTADDKDKHERCSGASVLNHRAEADSASQSQQTAHSSFTDSYTSPLGTHYESCLLNFAYKAKNKGFMQNVEYLTYVGLKMERAVIS